MNCKIIKLTKYPSNKIVKLDFFPKSYIYYCEYKDKKIFDFDEMRGISIFEVCGLNIKIIDKVINFQSTTENTDTNIKFKIILLG